MLKLRVIEFVTLKVQSLDNKRGNLYPLLRIIKKGVEKVHGRWEKEPFETYLDDMHVTVRKYNETDSQWSSDFIQNCGILERVRENPLKFQCIALDITQTRRQARGRYSSQWWLGVTGISLKCRRCRQYFPNKSPGYCPTCGLSGCDHKCSACQRKEVKQIGWPGNCVSCNQYERVNPLWSTSYQNQ